MSLKFLAQENKDLPLTGFEPTITIRRLLSVDCRSCALSKPHPRSKYFAIYYFFIFGEQYQNNYLLMINIKVMNFVFSFSKFEYKFFNIRKGFQKYDLYVICKKGNLTPGVVYHGKLHAPDNN
jgi:hypothetical protein